MLTKAKASKKNLARLKRGDGVACPTKGCDGRFVVDHVDEPYNSMNGDEFLFRSEPFVGRCKRCGLDLAFRYTDPKGVKSWEAALNEGGC
jgi:hypothetical protein